MATGPGLGALLPIAMALVGLVAMFRRKGKSRPPTEADRKADQHQAAAADMERRMAAYLALQGRGLDHNADPGGSKQENSR